MTMKVITVGSSLTRSPNNIPLSPANQSAAAQVLAQETLFDMIAMSLASNAKVAVHLSQPEQGVLMRAKTFVQASLGDESLNRKRVAAAWVLSSARTTD